jgi:hypothetical protein
LILLLLASTRPIMDIPPSAPLENSIVLSVYKICTCLPSSHPASRGRKKEGDSERKDQGVRKGEKEEWTDLDDPEGL